MRVLTEIDKIADADADATRSTGGWASAKKTTGHGRFFDDVGDDDRNLRDSDSPDVDADERTAVETFRQSPPSSGQLSGVEKAIDSPAWGAEVDQEDVLSSLDFANVRPPLIRAAPEPVAMHSTGFIDDDDFDDDLDAEYL